MPANIVCPTFSLNSSSFPPHFHFHHALPARRFCLVSSFFCLIVQLFPDIPFPCVSFSCFVLQISSQSNCFPSGRFSLVHCFCSVRLHFSLRHAPSFSPVSASSCVLRPKFWFCTSNSPVAHLLVLLVLLFLRRRAQHHSSFFDLYFCTRQ